MHHSTRERHGAAARRLSAPLAGGLFLAVSLACGGGGAGSIGGGSSASDRAERTCEYNATEEEVECITFGEGQIAKMGDFSFEFGTPELIEPENRLPWIGNHTERSKFADGVKALAVPYKRRNDSPVKVKDEVWVVLQTSDGETAYAQAYNTRLYNDRAGTEQPWDHTSAPPDKWVETALVFAVDPEAADGALAWIGLTDTRKDARGRKETFTSAQAVVDLADAVEADSLRQ